MQWRAILSGAVGLVVCAVLVGAPTGPATGKGKAPPKVEAVFTDVDKAPADFKFQGEYEGTAGDKKIGVQVIALGDQKFQCVFHQGGLPGAGWDKSEKVCIDAKMEGDMVLLAPSKAKKKYMAVPPDEFSATDKPPAEQKAYSGTIQGGELKGKSDAGVEFACKRVVRESPTLGAKPPEGAIVLFDGTKTDEFNGGRLDADKKVLCTDGKDITTKRKFNNYTAHVEFMLPYKPTGRGQGRGNSGFYQVDCYEVQVLDSFGLMGKNNECGGIYTKADPKVNMCLPPLQWQTYDVDFRNAEYADGKKVKSAVATLKHNGVVIHENFEISGPTGGGRKEDGTPGPIKLQGHGNPLQYRNVWVVEQK